MERSVELFAFITFVVSGISHILHHREWAEFVVYIRDRGHAGVLFNGFIVLTFGAFIVSFHPVWNGPAAVLTAVGYLMVFKGIMVFTSPELGMKSMRMVNPEKSYALALVGVFKIIIGGCAGWELWN
ncbi:MAG: hypothetical protein EXR99_06705 [Gemmataceae bacterium]|nr:hypothetical protein [Gemmataceae bacterium]